MDSREMARRAEATRRHSDAQQRLRLARDEIRVLRGEASRRALTGREKRDLEALQRAESTAAMEMREAVQAGALDPRDTTGVPAWPGGDGVHVLQGKQDRNPDVLRPEQRMADWVAERSRGGVGKWSASMQSELDDPSRFSLGRMIRSYVRGDWSDAELEQRALSEGVNASGGFLLPSPLSSRVIDKIRNAMQVSRAGAQVVPMEFPYLAMPRLTADATAEWHAEAGSLTPSTQSFDRVVFNAKTIDVLVQMSRELFEDVPAESAALIEESILKTVALEIDRACLRGSGSSNQPLGVLGQTGVILTSMGANGAQPHWDDIIDAVTAVRNNNLEPSAILWASRTQGVFDKFKDSYGRYLEPPPSIAAIEQLVTNQIPINLTVGTSNNCSEIYIGDWSQLLIGWRTGIGFGVDTPAGVGMGDSSATFTSPGVRVLQERYADTLSVGLLVYARLDVQLQHPQGFNVMTGVTPT